MRTGPISSKHVCIVTTRRMWQFQTNKNVNLISVAWLVIVTNLQKLHKLDVDGLSLPTIGQGKGRKPFFYARSVQLMYIMLMIIGLPKYFSFLSDQHLP